MVLQCYGAGNMPSNRQDIIDALGRDLRDALVARKYLKIFSRKLLVLLLDFCFLIADIKFLF